MSPSIAEPEATQSDVSQKAQSSPSVIHAHPGFQPVTDIEAFLASLTDMDFEPGEFEAFEQAIAEDRAQRRAMCAQETQ